MSPDPIEKAIDEQLQSAFPQAASDKKGRVGINPCKGRRRTETIFVEMVDRMMPKQETSEAKLKGKRSRRRRKRGHRVLATPRRPTR